MATQEEINAFRLIIDETGSSTIYSDEILSDRLDAATNDNALASQIWLEKAAKFSRLVDIQEGTSSRKLSQMQVQALAMATKYSGLAEDPGSSSGTVRRTTTRPIERP